MPCRLTDDPRVVGIDIAATGRDQTVVMIGYVPLPNVTDTPARPAPAAGNEPMLSAGPPSDAPSLGGHLQPKVGTFARAWIRANYPWYGKPESEFISYDPDSDCSVGIANSWLGYNKVLIGLNGQTFLIPIAWLKAYKVDENDPR